MSAASQTVAKAMSDDLRNELENLSNGQFLIYIKGFKHLVTGTAPVQFRTEFGTSEEINLVDNPSDAKAVSEKSKATEDSVLVLLAMGMNVQISIYSSKNNSVSLSIPSSMSPNVAHDSLTKFLNENLQPSKTATQTAATAASPSK